MKRLHISLGVEDEAELAEMSSRLKNAGQSVDLIENNECCYACQDKFWISDPQGLPWETFQTHEQIEDYGTGTRARDLLASAKPEKTEGCCG